MMQHAVIFANAEQRIANQIQNNQKMGPHESSRKHNRKALQNFMPAPETPRSVRTFIDQQLSIFDCGPVIVNKGCDVYRCTTADQHEIILVGIAVGKMRAKNSA
jgi:hypothetical protein